MLRAYSPGVRNYMVFRSQFLRPGTRCYKISRLPELRNCSLAEDIYSHKSLPMPVQAVLHRKVELVVQAT